MEVSGVQHKPALHHLLLSLHTSFHDTGASCQMHTDVGCQAGSAPALCSMCVITFLLG